MAAVSSACRSPLTSSIVNYANPNRNVGQPYKRKNIQSVAIAPADDIRLLSSLKSARLRFSQFQYEAALPFPNYICRCSFHSNSNSSSSSLVRPRAKRAFISVSNKIDLAFLGSGLHNLGFTIVSTGGTAVCLENNGVPVTRVEQLTRFPELFNGPVETMLSSSMGAGKDSEHHMESLKNLRIGAFDVVVANFSPFAKKIYLPVGVQHEEEGPELIHTLGFYTLLPLAKDYEKVLVVVDPQDYRSLLEYLKGEQDNHQFRKELAKKAIQHVIMCLDAKHAWWMFLDDEEAYWSSKGLKSKRVSN